MEVWIGFSQGSVWEIFLFPISVNEPDNETNYKSIQLMNLEKNLGKQ